MIHKVEVKVPFRELGKSDVVFTVKNGRSKIGTLKISKGGVVWSSKSKKYGKKMGWSKFDRMMKENTKIREKN